jgi:1,4-alpha-glucan branching enzyme
MQSLAYGELDAIVHATHGAPFRVLGPHLTDNHTLIVRAFLPQASAQATVSVEIAGARTTRHQMERIAPEGLFELTLPRRKQIPSYQLIIAEPDGRETRLHDPYAFPPMLSDFDLQLLGEGQHHQAYEKLGAHIREVNGVTGVNFAVWAPNAQRVSVIGDFNQWDGRRHPMQRRNDGGIWELFIPELGANERYKYAIASQYQGYYTERRPLRLLCGIAPRHRLAHLRPEPV